MNNNLKQEIIEFKLNNKPLIFVGKKRIRLKTEVSISNEFKETDLYYKIYQYTSFLPIDINLLYRLKAILLNINKNKKCPICKNNTKINKSLKMSDPFFCITCNNTTCRMKHMVKHRCTTDKFRKNHSIAQSKHKQRLLNIYNNLITLDIKQYKNDKDIIDFINLRIQQRIKNGKIIKELDFINNKTILLSILNKTKLIPIPNNIKSVRDFSFNERMYCILNNINEKQVCKYCGNDVKFISLKHGYTKSCPSCADDKYREKIGYIILSEMKKLIDLKKYEILSFPVNVSVDKLIVKCKKCNYISEHFIYNGRGKNLDTILLCKNCEKYSSTEENKLRLMLTDNNIEIIVNTRSLIHPYEIDIYIPNKNIAIEFDGLYWHNDKCVKNNYHLNKTELCEEKGIRLIHIFENEWLHKQDIVKSRLKNILGIHDKTVFARKCKIKEITSKISKQFQDENHIQGSVGAAVHLGLFYEDKLISLMTFGKTRFSKKYEYELLRFCNKLNYHVPGGAGKLLKYFEINYKPKSIVSYADRRWSQGKLYKALGFELSHKSPPNYWYYKTTSKLLSRVQFQKHKLKDKLENFDPNLSEYQNMINNGYSRIYDCGNLVFIKNY